MTFTKSQPMQTSAARALSSNSDQRWDSKSLARESQFRYELDGGN